MHLLYNEEALLKAAQLVTFTLIDYLFADSKGMDFRVGVVRYVDPIGRALLHRIHFAPAGHRVRPLLGRHPRPLYPRQNRPNRRRAHLPGLAHLGHRVAGPLVGVEGSGL